MLTNVQPRLAVMLAALLFPSLSAAQIPEAQGAAPSMRCVPFASQERLMNGTSFRAPITPGLEVVLMSDPDGWIIQVEPAAEPGTDYLWIVSPPWQAAAHRYLGEGFGLTARQSLAMKRSLRFVTTRGAYQEAMAAYTAASRGPIEGIVERLAQLGQGSLSFEITGFDITPGSNGFGTETINWIEFRGEGCVPVAGAGRLNDTASSRSAKASIGLATPGGWPANHASVAEQGAGFSAGHSVVSWITLASGWEPMTDVTATPESAIAESLKKPRRKVAFTYEIPSRSSPMDLA